MYLKDKHILLGICGSIAAFKAVELIRLLQKEGATVQVMVTKSALNFVTEITLETLSQNKVLQDLFSTNKRMPHLNRKADLILIAPATANTIAKLSYGMADEIVSATVLGSACPVLIAPAMNKQMWNNFLVKKNVQRLKKAGYKIADPDSGYLACLEYGNGRLVNLQTLLYESIRAATEQNLKSKKVLITAGATREYFDEVRFLSNASSGKMALALAKEAYFQGADVEVILGHSEGEFNLPVKIFKIKTADEMAKIVFKKIKEVDIFISAAAVCDYKFSNSVKGKFKKTANDLSLNLKSNVDILKKVGSLKKKPFIVGFALESKNLIRNARGKFKEKSVDLMVVNTVESLGNDKANFWLMDKKKEINLGKISKTFLANKIFAFLTKIV